MKNSAWYPKLWRKKLDQLPVKGNVDAGWSGMSKMLNQQLPPGTQLQGAYKVQSLGAKIMSVLSYAIPAAAVIGAATYLATHHAVKQSNHKNKISISKRLTNDSLGSQKVDEDFKIKSNLGSPSDSLIHTDEVSAHQNAINAVNKNQPVSSHFTTTVKSGAAASNASMGRDETKRFPAETDLTQHRKYNTVVTPRSQVTTSSSSAHVLPLKDYIHSGDRSALKPVVSSVEKRDNERRIDSVSYTQIKKPGEVTVAKTIDSSLESNKQSNSVAAVKPMPAVERTMGASSSTGDKQSASNLQGAISKKSLNKQKGRTKPKAPVNNVARQKRLKSQRDSEPSAFDFGLEAGLNNTGFGKSFYAGATFTYNLNERWLIQSGLRYNNAQPVAGQHLYNFGYRDSTAFSINDSRIVNSFSLPLVLGYNLSDHITIYGGAQFNRVTTQRNIITALGKITNRLDTLGHTKSIDSAFRATAISKFSADINVGLSYRIGQLYLDARFFQSVLPLKVNTGLGTYKNDGRMLQFGIRYQFKKR